MISSPAVSSGVGRRFSVFFIVFLLFFHPALALTNTVFLDSTTLFFFLFVVFFIVGMVACAVRLPWLVFVAGVYIVYYGVLLFGTVAQWVGTIVSFLGLLFMYASIKLSV